MAKQLPEGSFQITDGPSKSDLMFSVFDGKVVKITCDIFPSLNGSLKICPKLDVIFSMIGAEDGSHESWIGSVLFCDGEYTHEHRSFYYSSKKRTGVIHPRKTPIPEKPSVWDVFKKM